MENGTYTMIGVGEGTGGGMMKNPMPGANSSWVAYVGVDDLKKAVDKAKSLGGKVMKDVTEVKEWARSRSLPIRPAPCSLLGAKEEVTPGSRSFIGAFSPR